jgi:predicted enzyme related to lactoylglutathione lyase
MQRTGEHRFDSPAKKIVGGTTRIWIARPGRRYRWHEDTNMYSGKERGICMGIAPEFEFALEYVEDVEEARHFYENVMGLKAERAHPTFVQYGHFAIASDERVGEGGEPELYWSVADADAALAELTGKAEIAVPMKAMPFGKVFAVKDPAGRPRFLLEWAKKRPSEAV